MLKIYQQTLSNSVNFEGIGLHSGKLAKITVKPGLADQGIIFKRIDIKKDNLIKANYKNVSTAKLCTTLENQSGVKVSTVEHLLAALYIAEIDNAIIEINNEEVPILDGSSKVFLKELKKTKLKELNKKRKYLKTLEKFELTDGNRNISLEPTNMSFEVNFKLNYENKIIGNQSKSVNFYKDNLEEVYESRTFCLYEDIEKIKKVGLAKGGSLKNAIVVNDEKILNPEGLRNQNEFVNHKILDLAGDFLLSGHRILGKVICDQGGHELTNKFLRKMLDSKTSYQILELKDFTFTDKTSSLRPTRVAVSA